MERANPTERKVSVLVVEDESLILEMVSEALAERGFDVYAVANATEALCHLDAGAAIDVLFTDINLPGMDGLTLATRARQMRPALPVVYASARIDAMRSGVAVPGSRFVPKPYDTARICDLLDHVAERH